MYYNSNDITLENISFQDCLVGNIITTILLLASNINLDLQPPAKKNLWDY